MLHSEGRLIVSPTDLVGFIACSHLTRLDWQAARDGTKPPFDGDPVLDLVNRKGREHEAGYLRGLRDQDLGVVDLANRGNKTVEESVAAEADTVKAMREGADIIYQGVFFDGSFRGRPDFLIKVAAPSSLGAWSYEVADTKLARDVKAGAIVQLVMYSLRLEVLQGLRPERMRVVTGDRESRAFRVDDYAAYVRRVRDRFLTSLADADALVETYPEPLEHCRVCRWAPVCSERRRADDHPSLVAGMTRTATRKLANANLTTLNALGHAKAGTEIKDLAASTFVRLRAQATLQLKQRADGVVRFELIEHANKPHERPTAPDKKPPIPVGLAALPLPTPDDLFFDIEADPWAGDGAGRGDGLEYLFGLLSAPSGLPAYEPHWAHSPDEEKAMLEAFIDRCLSAREANPGFRVYHYGAYEVSALRRLVHRYGTRDLDLDTLERARVFVDLYSVVRQGIRISQESYSLKKVEALYMPRREGPITRGGFSVVEYEQWLLDRDPKRLDDLAAYNRDDCISTWKLREWLEQRRLEAEQILGSRIPRPSLKSGDEEEGAAARTADNQTLIDALRKGVPASANERDPAEDMRWRLSLLLDFHRREARPEWWRWFDLRKLSPEELVNESDAIGDLQYVGPMGSIKQSTIHQYRFDPEQPQKFDEGDMVFDPVTGESAGTIHAIDAAAGMIELKRRSGGDSTHPKALIPRGPINTDSLQASLTRLASDVIRRGPVVAEGLFMAARELLLRRPPRIEGAMVGAPVRGEGETTLDAGLRSILGLRDSYLAIQGPPGTGKTWMAAQVILALHAAGKRVALTGPSHKVIGNLIHAVLKEASRTNVAMRIAQKADEGEEVLDPRVERASDNAALARAMASGIRITAGTAWTYASPAMALKHDVVFIDEAGQFSLANACAASATARSMVLIGDPNQLPQVTKATHPDGAGLSALEHVLNGEPTLDANQGLFLDITHRLHPDLCALVSDVFYQGRLRAEEKTRRVVVGGPRPLSGTGLRLRDVAHVNCASRSREEVDEIVDLMRHLIGRPWTPQEGGTRLLSPEDILIVAPFNAQVAAIRDGVTRALGVRARVGTVDKFQGQEAAVVLYSMTCSSAEDAPRDLEFLYSPNRLNVSISRAQVLSVIVYNSDLLRVPCRTPEQMKLANALCRVVDLAPAGS